jgi:hypothetical protein
MCYTPRGVYTPLGVYSTYSTGLLYILYKWRYSKFNNNNNKGEIIKGERSCNMKTDTTGILVLEVGAWNTHALLQNGLNMIIK